MPIIIDGWNLIRDESSRIDDDQADHLQGARDLIAYMEKYQNDHKDPITIVFDSRYEYLNINYKNKENLKIVPAADADGYIKKYIDDIPEKQRHNLRVVSSDKELYYYARDARATPVKSSEFWKKICIFLVIIAASLVYFFNTAWADTIYLKNKHVMEGIIQQENEKEVVLDIGFGEIAVSKTEIERVDRSDAQGRQEILRNWQNKYPETGRWVPEGAEDVFAIFKAVGKKREEIIDAKRRMANFQLVYNEQENELFNQQSRFSELNARFSAINKSDPYEYNKLVAEINAASAPLAQLANQVKKSSSRLKELSADYSDLMGEYREKLLNLIQYVNNEQERLGKQNAPEEKKDFYRWLLRELGEWNEDFEYKEVILKRQGGGIAVDVILNGSARTSLIVDTGAELVTISDKVARELGFPEGSGDRISVVLADGKTVGAERVILDSVNVNGFEIKNVEAAVIKNASYSGADGLLGMSYLRNFLMKIDSNKEKLILEKFK
ncbi:MAG: NYN domain-containing protein [Candidatus Omnitrophica bacterium]|nr:NYN domain-containing protein [Candidatus Omnitrophota bacterium]